MCGLYGFPSRPSHICLCESEKWKCLSLSPVLLFETPWNVACQAPLSMEFSRQEHWSGLPFLSPGDLPHPGIKPRSPALQADSLPSEPPEKLFPVWVHHRNPVRYSVQFSRPVMSESLQPHGQQHTRLPCPSPTPRACSNSCPASQWCHPTVSFSIVPFSSHLQSFPASGSFPVSQFFISGGQMY